MAARPFFSLSFEWRGFSRLAVAGSLFLSSAYSLWLLVPWSFQHYSIILFGQFSDFYIYRTDAARALSEGWGTYYNDIPNVSGSLNVNPPLQGLILFPILGLPYVYEFLLWTAFSILCLLLLWKLIGASWRLFPFALLLFPTLFAFRLGQAVILVGALIVLAWWLSEHRHGFSAGLILSLATLKPQLILLLPLALLLAGYKREFVGFAVGGLLLGLLSLALVGFGGAAHFIADLQGNYLRPDAYHVFNLALRTMVPGPIGPVLVGAAILLTLYLAWRARGHTPATVFALGLWGSLLIAPYIHPQDLMLWIPAALLMRKEAGLPVWLLILGILFASTTWLGAPIVPALALLVLWRYLVMAPKVASASTVALAVTPSRAEAEGAR